jgi:predicted amidohydrolase YtcJ
MIYGSDCRRVSPRIEHAQVLRRDVIERMASLGVTACIQPGFGVTDHDSAMLAIGDRREMAYRWDLLVDAGVPVICGSDYPIETLDPLVGLRNLVENPFAPLPCSTALTLMTNPDAGSTVLSSDPRTAPDLGQVSVVATRPHRRAEHA